mmetsp:Transcript_347/g.1003  ORF Transcript_347/g.1003 Transcript_347/m.1003 type:complete len:221 (+) Transcript_347:192-854(+)
MLFSGATGTTGFRFCPLAVVAGATTAKARALSTALATPVDAPLVPRSASRSQQPSAPALLPAAAPLPAAPAQLERGTTSHSTSMRCLRCEKVCTMGRASPAPSNETSWRHTISAWPRTRPCARSSTSTASSSCALGGSPPSSCSPCSSAVGSSHSPASSFLFWPAPVSGLLSSSSSPCSHSCCCSAPRAVRAPAAPSWRHLSASSSGTRIRTHTARSTSR